MGLHLIGWTNDALLVELGKTVPYLADEGINLIILQVNYGFDFESHPELRQGERTITRRGARRFAAICRQHRVRLIPQFQCLGHQSWGRRTFPLLTQYPELDITPGAFPDNEGIYCREWDPTNPRVNQIVFPLIEEIVAAFGADGIHVGMDEVFLLGSEQSPGTRGKNPAELFAKVVNELHDHFVKEMGLEMFMWGDRLIDAGLYGQGGQASSAKDTAPAVDMIPTDIVICDWHYQPRGTYPSIPMFLEKGFRVLPGSWYTEGVEPLVKYSYRLRHPNMMGHLFTTWTRLDPESLRNYRPMLTGIRAIRSGKYYDVDIELGSVSDDGSLEVVLAVPGGGLRIHYTMDGSEPTERSPLYERALHVDRNATIKAIACRKGVVVSEVSEKRFLVHKATGKGISLATPFSAQYPPGDGAATLVNGVTGSHSYADGQWVGMEGSDLEVLIDLGGPTEVSTVSLNSMNDRPNRVHHSPLVEVFGSGDGRMFTRIGESADATSDDQIVRLNVVFRPATTRYLKVLIHNQVIPEGFSGAGRPAWIFVDEIAVH